MDKMADGYRTKLIGNLWGVSESYVNILFSKNWNANNYDAIILLEGFGNRKSMERRGFDYN